MNTSNTDPLTQVSDTAAPDTVVVSLADRTTRDRIRSLMKYADPAAYNQYQAVKYPQGRASKNAATITAANQFLADWLNRKFVATNIEAPEQPVAPQVEEPADVYDEEDDD